MTGRADPLRRVDRPAWAFGRGQDTGPVPGLGQVTLGRVPEGVRVRGPVPEGVPAIGLPPAATEGRAWGVASGQARGEEVDRGQAASDPVDGLARAGVGDRTWVAVGAPARGVGVRGRTRGAVGALARLAAVGPARVAAGPAQAIGLAGAIGVRGRARLRDEARNSLNVDSGCAWNRVVTRAAEFP